VSSGGVDLLCGVLETLTGRKEVSFSIPIFPGGIGALLRADAPARLKLALEGQPLPNQPLWRGTPVEVFQHKTFSAVAGSIAETWLKGKIDTFKILATVSPVESFDSGVEKVAKGTSDVMFGDRDILLDAARRSPSAGDLVVLDRLFTLGPVALALPRGDEDFRLLIDQTLSQLFATSEFTQLYIDNFGEPRENILLFFHIVTIPE
jgi:putrescine:ornithine antiporter